MKVSCLTEQLSSGMTKIDQVVRAQTTRAAIHFVLLETDQHRLKLTANNLDMCISYWMGAKVEEAGSINVPLTIFAELVSSLPSDCRIDFHVLPESEILELKCGRSETRISGSSKRNHRFSTKGEDVRTTIDIGTLRKAINYVVFAASSDESRPILTGINAVFEANLLTIAAADGFRLSEYKLPLSKPVVQRIDLTIPISTIRALSRLISGQLFFDFNSTINIDIASSRTSKKISISPWSNVEDIAEKETFPMDSQYQAEIVISRKQNLIRFNLGNCELASQLILGSFPGYKSLIPQGSRTKATLGVSEFLRVVKTAGTFAQHSNGMVRLIMSPNQEAVRSKIAVYARSEGVGDHISEVDASVEGNESKIAIDVKYLTDVLSSLEENIVTIETNDPSAPLLIKAFGDTSYNHVIMPMFVQW